jgi:hypothetical protein
MSMDSPQTRFLRLARSRRRRAEVLRPLASLLWRCRYRRPLASIRATVERFVPGSGSTGQMLKNFSRRISRASLGSFFFFFSTTCNTGEECQQLHIKTWKLIILQIDLNFIVHIGYKMAQLGSSVTFFKKNSGNFFSSVKYLTNCSIL